MGRFAELLDRIRSTRRHASDWWLQRYYEERHPEAVRQSDLLDAVFETIDDESWEIFRDKLEKKFPDEDVSGGRGKHGFFNTVNEAYAYQYLIQRGFASVRFIKESKEPGPDLCYSEGQVEKACEVKTLETSQEEIELYRSTEPKVIDVRQRYQQLGDGFRDKFVSAIERAEHQVNGPGCIFMIVQFDDFTLQFKSTYADQIASWIADRKTETEIVVYALAGGELVPISEHNPAMD